MTTTILNPLRLFQTLVHNQRAKAEENRRRSALFHARQAFDYFEFLLDELTDNELEILLRHAGQIAAEFERRKRAAIDGVIRASVEAIK